MFLVRTVVSSEGSARKEEMCPQLVRVIAGRCLSLIKGAPLGRLISCRMPRHLQLASSRVSNPRKS